MFLLLSWSDGRFWSLSICVTQPVCLDLKSLLIKRTPRLWTFSSFSISATEYGSQTAAAYSRDERTSARYAARLVCIGQFCRFLLTKPKVELALLQTLLMWVFHLMSFDIITPRYGFAGTSFRKVLSSWLFIESM